ATRKEHAMRNSSLKRLATLVLVGLVAVAASGAAQPARADMLGPFGVTLTGQGMYASSPSSGQALGSLTDGVVLVQTLGLAPPEGERAYVGWLVNPTTGAKLNTGILQPVGAGGAYTAVYTAGRSLAEAQFTTVVVTLEPTMNRSDRPAGEPVLAGS